MMSDPPPPADDGGIATATTTEDAVGDVDRDGGRKGKAPHPPLLPPLLPALPPRLRRRSSRRRRRREGDVDVGDVDYQGEEDDDSPSSIGGGGSWCASSSSSFSSEEEEARQGPSPPASFEEEDPASSSPSTPTPRGATASTTSSFGRHQTRQRQQQRQRPGREPQEYERAIRRALGENEIIKSANARLLSELGTLLGGGDDGDDDDAGGVANAIGAMKSLVVELADACRAKDDKIAELDEDRERRLRLGSLEKAHFDEIVRGSARDLEAVTAERDEALLLQEEERASRRAWEGGVDREKTTKDRTRTMREGEFEELRVVLASAKAELARVRRERDEARSEARAGAATSDVARKEWDDLMRLVEEERAAMTEEREGMMFKIAEATMAERERRGEGRIIGAVENEGDAAAATLARERYEALRASIAGDRERWEGRVRAAEAERDELKAANVELEAAFGRLASETDGWRAQIAESAGEASRAATERDGLSAELGAARATLVVAEMERDCVVAERSSLRNDVGRLVDELARVESEREGLTRELDGVRATLADVNGDRLVKEGSALRNDIAEMADELTRVASERDDAMRELDVARASMLMIEDGGMAGEFTIMRDDLTADELSSRGEMVELSDRLARELSAINILKGELDSARDENLSLRNDIAFMGGEMTRVTSQRDDLARQLDGISSSLAEISRERDGLAADKLSLQNEIDDVTERLTEEKFLAKEELKMEVASLRWKVRDVAAAREAEVFELRREMERGMERSDLFAENSALQRKIETFQSDILQMSAAYEADLRSLQKATSDKEDAEYLLSELTKQVSDDKLAHEEFREATGEQLSAKERIETELRNEREKLTESIAILVRERDGLVMQLEELRRGGSEDDAVIEDLQSRSATSKKELSQSLESAGAEKGSLLKEKDNLLEKCSESAAKLEEVTSAARLHTSHIEALGDEVQQLRKENEGLCRLMKTLECDHAEVLKRVMDEKSLEITALEEKMNEIIDKTLGTMEEQLKMTILEKKETAKSLTEAEYRLSELTKQVSDDKVAHEEFREAENSINALNVQLAERNKAGEDLSLELQHAKVKASKERVLLNSKISSLEVDLLRSENEVERLGFAMNALTNSHANAVTRLEDIKHGLVNQKHLLNQTTEMEQRMKIMVSEVEKANAQLDDAKKVAREESDRLNGNIAILESDLIESRSDLEAVEKSLNDTTTKMSELLAEKEIMRKEISNLYSSVNEMGKENNQISRSINRMIGDLDMEDDDMISQSAARAVRTSNDGGELIETSLSMQILGKMKVSFQLLQSDRADMQIDIKEKTAAISDLEVRVQQISARNKVLSTECISLTTELHDSNKEASLEQDILSSKIALLEANLLQSTQEVERLNSEIKLLESNHAETRACLERDKNGLIELTKDTTQQIANLVEKIGYANAELNDSKKTSSLEIEQLNDTILTQAACLLESQQYGDSLQRDLDAVRKSLDDTTMKKNLLLAENETMQKSLNSSEFEAGWLEEQLSSKILSLEEELCKAKQEEERLGGVVESLEHSYAKERAHLEDGKIDLESRLDTLRGTSAAEQKQQSFKIASLEAELLQTLNEEERLVEVVKSLERSHAEELARFEEVNIDLECQIHTLKETSVAEQEQQSSKIASLETDLVQALKEEERLGEVVKSLERSHAEELARFEEVKIDLECRMHTMAETSASKQEQLRSAIVSLEADLLQVLQELDYAEEEKNGNQHRTHTLTETSAAENLQGNVLALKLTAKSLAEKAKKRSEEIHSLIQQVGDTEIRFNVNEAENRSLTIKISSLMMKNNDQYDQIVELTTCLEDETSENANLKKSLADEKLDNEVLGNRFAGLENERVAAMTKIEELSAELKSTAITLSDVQQLIIADQKQLLQMQDTIRSLEVEKQRDHDALQSITRDRDDNIRKLEFSRQEADDFKCKLESSESLAESITNQCEKVQSLLQASGNEVNYLKKKLEYSERMTKKLENECDNLNRSITELNTKRNEENQRNILRCRQQHETSQCEIACLENIIASLKKELDAFKSEARTATAAQLKSCEAKLVSLCANDEDGTLQRRDRTFDGLILALGKELSRLRGESTSTAKKLAEAQREFSSLESIVTLLKKEHEALRIEARAAVEAQIISCEAKLAPLCSNGGQGALSKQCRSFDNMIAIIQEELSSLSIMAKNLDKAQNESAILEQQVRILSSEVSKYKLQNRGMLQALDELTIGMGDSDAYS